MKTNIKRLVLSVFVASTPMFAEDGDSSADVTAGYATQVANSGGVIVKVAVDQNGNEMTDTAELRVVNVTDQPTSGSQASVLWEQNTVATPTTTTDSNTSFGWRYPGWNSWGYYGWQPSGYYYNYYTPQWNYGGYYYNYYRPNYAYNPYYGGYRYYYYYRHW